MNANIKIIDGFVWAVIDSEEALLAFESGEVVSIIDAAGAVFTLVDSKEDIDTMPDSLFLAIELGWNDELTSDWQEACARNNEKRSFEAWLEDKAENLIE